jgi:uncharacterized protein (DUF983 family)
MTEPIPKEMDYGEDEWYGMIYACPYCVKGRLMNWFCYCPDCGHKLYWGEKK